MNSREFFGVRRWSRKCAPPISAGIGRRLGHVSSNRAYFEVRALIHDDILKV